MVGGLKSLPDHNLRCASSSRPLLWRLGREMMGAGARDGGSAIPAYHQGNGESINRAGAIVLPRL